MEESLQKYEEKLVRAGLVEPGYRAIANVGPDSGQLVPHLHVHICGGRPLGALVPA